MSVSSVCQARARQAWDTKMNKTFGGGPEKEGRLEKGGWTSGVLVTSRRPLMQPWCGEQSCGHGQLWKS